MPLYLAEPSFEASAQLIRHMLDRSPYPAIRRIICDYEHHVLTLRGCIPTFYLKQLVLTSARKLPGVEAIVDRLEVTPTQPAPSGD